MATRIIYVGIEFEDSVSEERFRAIRDKMLETAETAPKVYPGTIRRITVDYEVKQ